MYSLKSLYKIGHGPSSSHTMGPSNAIKYVLKKYQNIDFIKMTFYGSLALTGKGHLADYIAELSLKDVPHKIEFDYETKTSHPNTMIFEITIGEKIFKETIISIGGGLIEVEGEKKEELYKHIYPHNHFSDIKKYCETNRISLDEYVDKYDDKDIDAYLETVYQKMMSNVEDGLKKDGYLPGKLKVKRKAKEIYYSIEEGENEQIREKRLICAYAFAASEENASGGEVVTAPTCGACGIIPALVKYFDTKYSHRKIINALKVAGIIGLIVKHNASISGAECGCQAEIGTASSMGAAFVTFLRGGSIYQIERAAEISMEHLLGLTCDPIEGYVQIPCIERNAVYALRSIEAASLALFIDPSMNKISFDTVVETMYQTGKDLLNGYRETAQSGLAKNYEK